MKKIDEAIKKIFKDNNLSYSYHIFGENKVEITIKHGDWKKDHIRLQLLLEGNGFVKVSARDMDEDVFEYSCVYVYEYYDFEGIYDDVMAKIRSGEVEREVINENSTFFGYLMNMLIKEYDLPKQNASQMTIDLVKYCFK